PRRRTCLLTSRRLPDLGILGCSRVAWFVWLNAHRHAVLDMLQSRWAEYRPIQYLRPLTLRRADTVLTVIQAPPGVHQCGLPSAFTVSQERTRPGVSSRGYPADAALGHVTSAVPGSEVYPSRTWATRPICPWAAAWLRP